MSIQSSWFHTAKTPVLGMDAIDARIPVLFFAALVFQSMNFFYLSLAISALIVGAKLFGVSLSMMMRRGRTLIIPKYRRTQPPRKKLPR